MNVTLNALLADTNQVVLYVALAAVAALVIGFLIGYFIFKTVRAKRIGETSNIVAKMIEDAENESKQIKKEAILFKSTASFR